MKKSHILMIFVFCILLSISGCGFDADRESLQANSANYSIGYLVEVSEENAISVEIPVFETESENVNETIYNMVVKNINRICNNNCDIIRSENNTLFEASNAVYTEYYININCDVSYYSDSIISITFKGLSNYKTAAHPNHVFFALNIDPVSGDEIILSDMYALDSKLYEIFSDYAERDIWSNADLEWLDNWEGFSETICSEDDFLKGIKEQIDYYFYCTKESLVISYPVPHSMGDYMTVSIPYIDLAGQGIVQDR